MHQPRTLRAPPTLMSNTSECCCTDLRAENAELRAENFNLQILLSDARLNLDDARAALSNRNTDGSQVLYLHQRLAAKSQLLNRYNTFDKTIETHHVGVPKFEIQKYYSLVYFSLDDCSAEGAERSPGALREAIHQLSDSLDSTHNLPLKASGRDPRSLLQHSIEQGIEIYLVFEALMASRIFDLVFRPVFPEILALESPLLNQYRQQIFALGGPKTLCRLDHISLKSLVSEEHLAEELISEKSNSLAKLMLTGLWPLVSPEWRDISQGQQESKMVKELAFVLRDAMRLKNLLVLSMERIRFHFFRPGDLWDSSMMQQHMAHRQEGEPISVKLCILPALFHVQGSIDNSVESAVYHTSASDNEFMREVDSGDLQSLVLIAKATVLAAA